MAKFILELKFDKDNERRLAVRPHHREYLCDLFNKGKLLMAGPWPDDSGALIIYEVKDESEIKSILAADPYIQEDVISVASLRQWLTILPS